MEEEQVSRLRPLAREREGRPPPSDPTPAPSDRLLPPDEAAALQERVTLNGHFRFELRGRGTDIDRQLDAIDQELNTLRDYDRSVQTEE